MTAHPSRPGVGSAAIDLLIVAGALLILGCLGLLAWVAFRAAARGARAVTGLLRPRRWPRDRKGGRWHG